jgi:hypothetical protein
MLVGALVAHAKLFLRSIRLRRSFRLNVIFADNAAFGVNAKCLVLYRGMVQT